MNFEVYKNKKKRLIISLILILSITVGSYVYYMQDRWQYREIMKDAVAKKMADKNPNPVFDGIQEPPLHSEDEVFNDPIGPDRNKNGIRDDIDIWINRSVHDYNLRMGYRQYARSKQEIVSASLIADYSNSSKLATNTFKAIYCLDFITKSNSIDTNVIHKIDYNIQSLSALPKTRRKNDSNFSNSIRFLNPEGVSGEEYLLCLFKLENSEILIKKYNKILKKE